MDEKTKIEIWETFKDKFIKEGVNSPNELVFQDKLPTEKKLLESGRILKKIGKFGKLIIWLIKKAVWAGGAIVIFATLPGAIEDILTRYPKAFEDVHNIGHAIKSYNNSKPIRQASKDENQKQYNGQYVAFNDNWLRDRNIFLQDTEALDTKGIISDNTVLAPATGLDPLVIMQSDISVAPSDLT